MKLVLDLNKSINGGDNPLVEKKITVTRNGKSFLQTFHVKVGDEVTINTSHGEKRGKVDFIGQNGGVAVSYEHEGKTHSAPVAHDAIKQVHRNPDKEDEIESESLTRAKALAKKNKRAKLSETERADAIKKLKRMKGDVDSLAYSIEHMDVGPNTAARYQIKYEAAVQSYNDYRSELQTKYGMTDEELGSQPKPAQVEKKEEPKSDTPAQVYQKYAKRLREAKSADEVTSIDKEISVDKVIDTHDKSQLQMIEADVLKKYTSAAASTPEKSVANVEQKEPVKAPAKIAKKQTVANPTSILDHIKNGDKATAMNMAKEAGITWVEHSNPNINWMRAHVAIKNHYAPPKAKADQLSDKIAEYKTNPSDKLKGSIFRLAKELGNEEVMKEYAHESRALESAKNANSSSLAEHIKNGNKAGAMAEAKKLGITWNEHENANVNWMRAAIAIKKHLQSKTDEVSKKSLADLMNLMKSWAKETKPVESLNKSSNAGNSNLVPKKVTVTKNGKTFQQTFWVDPNDPSQTPQNPGKTPMSHKDLHAKLHEHIQAGRKEEAMKMAKENGITWKEHDHSGINWMRANMAIKKHHDEGADKEPVKPKMSDEQYQDAMDKHNAKENMREVEIKTINGITDQMKAMQKIKVKTSQQKQQLDQLQQRLIAANVRLREIESKSSKPTGEPKKEQSKEQSKASSSSAPAPSNPSKEPKTPSGDTTSKLQQLLTSGDKQAAMAEAKKLGITWQEHEHAGVNWMRAAMAIKKHIGGDNAVNTQASEPKQDQSSQKPSDNSAIIGDTHLLLDDEKELLTKYASSHFFTYKVSKASSGAAKIDVFNDKKNRIASLQIYSDAVQSKNGITGGEAQYKDLSTALSAIGKQLKTNQGNKPPKEVSKNDVLADIINEKSKEYAKSRMKSVESAIKAMMNGGTFGSGNMEYNLRNHGVDGAKKRFEDDLRAHQSGARMTEAQRDVLGSGPYGMSYKYEILKDWEDQEWEKARQQGLKKIDKLNEDIGAPDKMPEKSETKAQGSQKAADSKQSHVDNSQKTQGMKSIVVETPNLRKQGSTFSSHYKLNIQDMPYESWSKKAFIVNSDSQVSSFTGVGGIKFYNIKSKQAFASHGSGGAANTLQVQLPEEVFKELTKNLNKDKYYAVKIGNKQPQSSYSYGDTVYIKGGSLKI